MVGKTQDYYASSMQGLCKITALMHFLQQFSQDCSNTVLPNYLLAAMGW